MVPLFEEFLYPFLKALKDGDVTSKEMKEYIIKHFSLSEADCALMTKNGTSTQVTDRINWTRQYLRRALFIDIPKRGVYRITQRGKEYLESHTTLHKADLVQYPEFAAYAIGGVINTSHSSTTTTSVPSTSSMTPTDQLEDAYQTINKDLAADLLQKVMDQTPKFFEQLVVDLLVKMGYGGSFADSAKVTQLSNDEGIDGIIYEDKLGLDKIYIQAKRWSNQVGRPVIQQFAGALVGQNATKGVFITTSTYSKEARQYVCGLHQKIVLIDGQELANFMIEYNVGVSTKKTYEVKRIDTDYFEE